MTLGLDLYRFQEMFLVTTLSICIFLVTVALFVIYTQLDDHPRNKGGDESE